MQEGLKMKIIAMTRKGMNKKENEDRIVVGRSVFAEGVMSGSLENGVLAIADGVGGNNAGSAASHFVASKVSMLQDITEGTLREVNSGLLALSAENSMYNGMASTLSGILLSGGKGRLFSVGNTRVYFLQGGKYLKQLTADDTTLNYLLETGQLGPEEAENFDRRNEITACFGGGRADLFKMKISDIESVASPIIMTSDGIHDYLSVDRMEEIIERHGLTETACEQMLSAAREHGSCDDASIAFGII